MDLFNSNTEPINLLPFDGEVIYYGKIFAKKEAELYFDLLMKNIEWKNDEALIYGKKIITILKDL